MEQEAPSEPLEMSRAEFLTAVELLSPYADLELIGRAYDWCEKAHAGQSRESGERYFSHAAAVALSLAEWHQDTITISAGLMHDVVEDTRISAQEIGREFGEELELIVQGVTKISTQFVFTSSEAKQAENFRKMLVSMAKDIRVILVKFADRLHNMRTLEHLPREKQERIALETREIYAPLAHRLGMAKVRWELEDLAMKCLEPENYRLVATKVTARREEREKIIDSVRGPLVERVQAVGIDATVFGRPKHFYSIHRKMQLRQTPFEEIYDLHAIRVITDTVEHCYHILGIVHSLWRPLAERFKDYIATPKTNRYQSLHTTIASPSGDLVEIQIRTEIMDQTAEEGIAAHWLYKEQRGMKTGDDQFVWLRQLLETQREFSDPREFMENLKIDLFREECFVFTPKGDLKRLPRLATPIDFAFSIHTEVGLHCAGAKVNGRYASLASPLKSGDMVEIVTSPHQKPSRDWLGVVRTGRAKAKIRQALRRAMRESSLAIGRQIFERDAKKRRIRMKFDREFEEILKSLGFESPDVFYVALAEGEVSSAYVLDKIAPPKQPMRSRTPAVVERLIDRTRRVEGVRIEEVDDIMTRLAECCQPVPGDNVFGFITRGRGLTIHRVDCPNSFALRDAERRVEVQWSVKETQRFPVDVTVVARDRANLLYDLTKEIAKLDINMRGSSIVAQDGQARGSFTMEITTGAQLAKVLRDLRKVKGVSKVYRRSTGIQDHETPGEDLL